VLKLLDKPARLNRRVTIFEQRRFKRPRRFKVQLGENPIECVQIVWLQLENLMFGHQDGQTSRFPGDIALSCEVNEFAAKALLVSTMTQKFIEQIVCFITPKAFANSSPGLARSGNPGR
jgi:hypothetical protein